MCLMFTCYIFKFCKFCHGGPQGGPPLQISRTSLPFKKTCFFSYKYAYMARNRPSIGPACIPKIGPPSGPSFQRPPYSLKKVGFLRKLSKSAQYMKLQGASGPPSGPPRFTIQKFRIFSKFFPIIIFHKNAFPGPYKPIIFTGIRPCTMYTLSECLKSRIGIL